MNIIVYCDFSVEKYGNTWLIKKNAVCIYIKYKGILAQAETTPDIEERRSVMKKIEIIVQERGSRSHHDRGYFPVRTACVSVSR